MKISTFYNPALRLSALALALFSAAAQAQLVEYVELRRDGDDVVVQVQFVTPVQYLRSLSASSGDLGQIYYDVLPTRDNLNLITFERWLPEGASAPLLIVAPPARLTLSMPFVTVSLVVATLLFLSATLMVLPPLKARATSSFTV